MALYEVLLIGVALSTDAFAVTVANCTTHKNLPLKRAFLMPVFFALFQAAMPVIGFLIGSVFSSKISSAAGYISSAVFFLLAVKICFDNLKEMKENGEKQKDEKNGADKVTDCENDGFTDGNPVKKFSLPLVLLQAVVTSIDALAIGVTFAVALLDFTSSVIYSAVIGATTFSLVTLALFIGRTAAKSFGKYSGWIGAAILFAISVKTLLETVL